MVEIIFGSDVSDCPEILFIDSIDYPSSRLAFAKINDCKSLEELEKIRLDLFGSKQGILTLSRRSIGSTPEIEERKKKGKELNEVGEFLEIAIITKRTALKNIELNTRLEKEWLDITLSPRPAGTGTLHPITRVIDEITAIFAEQGFFVAEGPEIEDDFHNFTALNFPENHPARQMHDTFFLKPREGKTPILRTHTSPVQIRTMLAGKPPFRFIAPGKTFRCDSDMTHTPMFHQVEGFVIGKDITMGHLKGCVEQFLRSYFEIDNVPVRFRPSFFPFTEPSAEVDIGCARGKGELKIGAGKDWLEIMGCGMIHPNVLKNCNIDPEQWQGFAFGVGVERLAMLKYNIPDLRTFFESDKRWLTHYGFSPLGDAA